MRTNKGTKKGRQLNTNVRQTKVKNEEHDQHRDATHDGNINTGRILQPRFLRHPHKGKDDGKYIPHHKA